jgi:hypothetical protein
MKSKKVRIVSIASIFAICMAVSPYLRADGGEEISTKNIGAESVRAMNGQGGKFKVVKGVTSGKGEEKTLKEIMAQKVVFEYELKQIVEDTGEENVVATSKGSAVIPAGKKEVTIEVQKQLQELKSKIKRRGTLQIVLKEPNGIQLQMSGQTASLELINEDYRKAVVSKATSDPDIYNKFIEDYQKFVMANQGKDKKTVDREFLKKYPQYKDILPLQE